VVVAGWARLHSEVHLSHDQLVRSGIGLYIPVPVRKYIRAYVQRNIASHFYNRSLPGTHVRGCEVEGNGTGPQVFGEVSNAVDVLSCSVASLLRYNGKTQICAAHVALPNIGTKYEEKIYFEYSGPNGHNL
jgi:hypothetical protein